jgi:hypothetical protein
MGRALTASRTFLAEVRASKYAPVDLAFPWGIETWYAEAMRYVWKHNAGSWLGDNQYNKVFSQQFNLKFKACFQADGSHTANTTWQSEYQINKAHRGRRRPQTHPTSTRPRSQGIPEQIFKRQPMGDRNLVMLSLQGI